MLLVIYKKFIVHNRHTYREKNVLIIIKVYCVCLYNMCYIKKFL